MSNTDKGAHKINMEPEAAGDSAKAEDDSSWTEIRVFTLNCWGLFGISKYRKERMAAIGSYLSRDDNQCFIHFFLSFCLFNNCLPCESSRP